jgi:hypothetical protein
MSHSPPNTLLHQDRGVQPFPISYLAHMVHGPPRPSRDSILRPSAPVLCHELSVGQPPRSLYCPLRMCCIRQAAQDGS